MSLNVNVWFTMPELLALRSTASSLMVTVTPLVSVDTKRILEELVYDFSAGPETVADS